MEWYLVKLEFARVQTYLFADTQLKSMVGANARLGELLRGQLTMGGFVGEKNFPALAQKYHAKLPKGVVNNAPPRDNADPLNGKDIDDPYLSWSKGVLARDGGHFFAVFEKREHADGFVSEARNLAAQELAGLPLKAKIVLLTKVDGKWTEQKENDGESSDKGEVLLDLPQFQVCEFSQQGPASKPIKTADGEKRGSKSTFQKRETADRFAEGNTHDIVGLMLRPIADALEPSELENPAVLFSDEVTEITSLSDYLAVIHADGNSIGKRSETIRGPREGVDFFEREAKGEAFFHSMRVTVRRAVTNAIQATFNGVRTEHNFVPFRLLMLGGDDLLLICDAAFAPTFAVEYARKLKDLNLTDEKPLKIGMGIAIVRSSFPFHRAHQLVEQLADSAKRLSKEQTDGPSAIDWLSISEGWHDDIVDVRRRDSIRRIEGETLVLSGKPYPILNSDGPVSLQSLLEQAERAVRELEQTKAARSQLIALAQQLSHGRHQADWALHLVPRAVRAALEGIAGDSVWNSTHAPIHTTRLADFLELHELETERLKATKEIA